jgi:flagellar biosynthesis/type III secretory pathway chaperone
MANELGIDKTTSVLNALNSLSIKLIELGKDGFQISDATALIADEEVRNLLVEAYTAISGLKSELNDLNLHEGIELGMVQLAWVPRYVEAFQKKA